MELRILGPLEVWRDGRRVRISGAKERSLLAILLLHANEPVAVDLLIDDLWGANPPAMAKKSVQVRVAALRRALGGERLRTRAGGYLMRVDAHELDLLRFEQLVADAARALSTRDAATAFAGLRDALSLWRGPALADFTYESFAQGPIARLEELRRAATELRIDAELELGRHAELLPELHELVTLHPLRERLWGQLMLALYRAGRQADALDAYGRAREHLVDELGIEPSRALQSLQRAILEQEPSLQPVTAPARSILVAPQDSRRAGSLLALGEALARRPPRELLVAQLVQPDADVTAKAADLNERRQHLLDRGVDMRAITFTSRSPGEDLVRIALEQDVDLVLCDDEPEEHPSRTVEALLTGAPCDVAVCFRGEEALRGPVLVLFGGGRHDWAAVEVGAWIAGARNAPLRLAGPQRGASRDASRTLASASLAVQRVLGIAAEPLLVEPGEQHVLAAAEEAALIVVGLPEGRGADELGPVRSALVVRAAPPTLLVRGGLRPGGLAPRESLTRFTWTLGVS